MTGGAWAAPERIAVARSVETRTSPSLAGAIWGFVLLGALLASVSAWLLVNERLSDFRQAALAEAVTTRARGLGLDFARSLHQEWTAARIIAQDIARRDRPEIRSSLDLVVGDNSRVSWAGIAALDGTVMVASGRLLEGRNVAQRPWFQYGLEGNFAGDVHEAVLLAELLPSQSGEPRRFLDFATPVKDADGATSGVLGLHLDYEWAREHLRESARSLDLDVFLVNRAGEVVMASRDLPGTTLDLPSMRAAAAGASITSLETWPDGASYLTAVIAEVAYADLPSFGWSLVARIDDAALAQRSAFMALLLFLGTFGLLLVAITAAFVRIFATPFSKLAATAAALMRGEDIYPYESGSTAEAQTLSAAVARLQGGGER